MIDPISNSTNIMIPDGIFFGLDNFRLHIIIIFKYIRFLLVESRDMIL